MKLNKNLIWIFCIILLAKIILSLFILSPTIFSDEYIHLKLARSFYHDSRLTVHDIPIIMFPLYIIITSIANIFKDSILIYIVTKIINAVLSSLIIFPAFYLAKEFFDDKKSLLIASIISVFPASFALSPYIMNENLFYTLFLTSFYFLFRTINNNSLKNNILFGIFTSLALLTKITGVLLIFNFLLVIFIKKDYKKSLKNLIPFILFAITIFSWVIAVTDLKLDNLTLESITAGNSRVITNYEPIGLIKSITLFFIWVFNHLFYILLSLFIILPLAPLITYKDILKNNKEKYLLYLSVLFLIELIFVLSFKNVRPVTEIFQKATLFIPWFTGSILGRYIDTISPLLITLGFVGLSHLIKKINLKKYFTIGFIILILGSQALISSLFPVRNASLSWLGAIGYALNKILKNNLLVFFISLFIAVVILIASYYLIKRINLNKIPYIYITLFIFVSLISFSITFYTSLQLTKNPYFEFSKEIRNLVEKDSTLMIDERHCVMRDIRHTLCTKEIFSRLHSSLIGLWINSNIVTSTVDRHPDADYLVSHDKLDHQLLKEYKDIYLYKLERPLLIRQPYLQNVTDTSVTISFKTREPSKASILYSANQKGYPVATDKEFTDHHFITLKNLKQGDKYYYKLKINNQEIKDEDYFFHTNDPNDEEFNFIVFGDIGAEDGIQISTAERISNLKEKPDLIFIVGDVVYPDGLSEDYDKNLFRYFYRTFPNTAVFPALGNHDWNSDPKLNFEKEWFLPNNEHYYSLDYGNSHFIVLDSFNGTTLFDEENQMNWLIEDLKRNKNKNWKILIIHHNGLTCTYQNTFESLTKLYPILEEYKVDIVFTGNAHTYERLFPLKNNNPINQEQDPNYINPDSFITITTGAGGRLKRNWMPKDPCLISAKLHNAQHFTKVNINKNSLELKAINSITGEVFDTLKIQKTKDL